MQRRAVLRAAESQTGQRAHRVTRTSVRNISGHPDFRSVQRDAWASSERNEAPPRGSTVFRAYWSAACVHFSLSRTISRHHGTTAQTRPQAPARSDRTAREPTARRRSVIALFQHRTRATTNKSAIVGLHPPGNRSMPRARVASFPSRRNHAQSLRSDAPRERSWIAAKNGTDAMMHRHSVPTDMWRDAPPAHSRSRRDLPALPISGEHSICPRIDGMPGVQGSEIPRRCRREPCIACNIASERRSRVEHAAASCAGFGLLSTVRALRQCAHLGARLPMGDWAIRAHALASRRSAMPIVRVRVSAAGSAEHEEKRVAGSCGTEDAGSRRDGSPLACTCPSAGVGRREVMGDSGTRRATRVAWTSAVHANVGRRLST